MKPAQPLFQQPVQPLFQQPEPGPPPAPQPPVEAPTTRPAPTGGNTEARRDPNEVQRRAEINAQSGVGCDGAHPCFHAAVVEYELRAVDGTIVHRKACKRHRKLYDGSSGAYVPLRKRTLAYRSTPGPWEQIAPPESP